MFSIVKKCPPEITWHFLLFGGILTPGDIVYVKEAPWTFLFHPP